MDMSRQEKGGAQKYFIKMLDIDRFFVIIEQLNFLNGNKLVYLVYYSKMSFKDNNSDKESFLSFNTCRRVGFRR